MRAAQCAAEAKVRVGSWPAAAFAHMPLSVRLLQTQRGRRRIGHVLAVAQSEAHAVAAVRGHLQPAQRLRIRIARPAHAPPRRRRCAGIARTPTAHRAAKPRRFAAAPGPHRRPAKPARKEYRAARSAPPGCRPWVRRASVGNSSASSPTPSAGSNSSVSARRGQPFCGSSASSAAKPVGSPSAPILALRPARHSVCAASSVSSATTAPISPAAPVRSTRLRWRSPDALEPGSVHASGLRGNRRMFLRPRSKRLMVISPSTRATDHLPVARFAGAMHPDQVAVEDAVVDHRIALYLQQIVGLQREQGAVQPQLLVQTDVSTERLARGDPTQDRQGKHLPRPAPAHQTNPAPLSRGQFDKTCRRPRPGRVFARHCARRSRIRRRFRPGWASGLGLLSGHGGRQGRRHAEGGRGVHGCTFVHLWRRIWRDGRIRIGKGNEAHDTASFVLSCTGMHGNAQPCSALRFLDAH